MKDWLFMKISVFFTLLLRIPYRDLYYIYLRIPHSTAILIGLFRRFLRIWYTGIIYFAYRLNDSSITCFILSRLRHAEPDIQEELQKTATAQERSIHLCSSDMHFASFTFAVPNPLRLLSSCRCHIGIMTS